MAGVITKPIFFYELVKNLKILFFVIQGNIEKQYFLVLQIIGKTRK